MDAKTILFYFILFLSLQEPFPMGTHIRSRLGKPQSTGNEENHHSGSPSTLANEEDSPNGIHSPAGSDYVVFFGQDTNSNPVRV
jgi:hypothetical protein